MHCNLRTPQPKEVVITSGRRHLPGILSVPADCEGVIVFAHGSGSGRFSPRNQFVARVLDQAGLATLLIDLLEEEQALDRANVFDIPLLAERLDAAANWVNQQSELASLDLGYFGASTGAAAALLAAAKHPVIGAIVSRGGRPDLAGRMLPAVRAPTLLIVGGNDEVVLELNQQAAAQMRMPARASGRSRRDPSIRRARHARRSRPLSRGLVR